MKYQAIPVALLTVFTVSCKDNNPALTKIIYNTNKRQEEYSAKKILNGVRAQSESAAKLVEKYKEDIKNGRPTGIKRHEFDITIKGTIECIISREDEEFGRGWKSTDDPSEENKYIIKVLCETGYEDVHVKAYFINREDVISVNSGDTITIKGKSGGISHDGVWKEGKLTEQTTTMNLTECNILN